MLPPGVLQLIASCDSSGTIDPASPRYRQTKPASHPAATNASEAAEGAEDKGAARRGNRRRRRLFQAATRPYALPYIFNVPEARVGSSEANPSPALCSGISPQCKLILTDH